MHKVDKQINQKLLEAKAVIKIFYFSFKSSIAYRNGGMLERWFGVIYLEVEFVFNKEHFLDFYNGDKRISDKLDQL